MNPSLIKTDDFIQFLKDNKIEQGHIININNKITVSESFPKSLSDTILEAPDYAEHEAIIFRLDHELDALFLVGVHRTNRGSGQGGTRFKRYENTLDLFTDVIRLSKGMTEKNSLAEIWWGGGKGIIHPITMPTNPTDRKNIFISYGKFVASLQGLYICAEDMNTTPEDMRHIHAYNRFCTCVPKDIGGSSNPSFFTAKGVFQSILAGFDFLEGNTSKTTDLSGKHILIEGAGNVGFHVFEQIMAAGGKVTLFEINSAKIDYIKANFSPEQVTIVDTPEALYKTKADLFSPNAIGATVNPKTLELLDVKMIIGGANNQLADPVKDAQLVHEKGIIYAPDFVVNCMGIINCANEQYGYIPSEIEAQLEKIHPRVLNLLKEAKADNISPQFKAIEKAEQLSRENHPIWGHRGEKIIDYLLNQDYFTGKKQATELV